MSTVLYGIAGIRLPLTPSQKDGILEYSIKYGHPDHGICRLMKRKGKVTVSSINPAATTIVEQSTVATDEPCKERFP